MNTQPSEGAIKAAEEIQRKLKIEWSSWDESNAAEIIDKYISSAKLADARWPHYILGQIINSLPKNRDWLDPALESAAKTILAEWKEGQL